MFARKNWYRAGTLILFICALVIVGCGKNADTPKPIDDPPAVAPKAEPKKTGDITMDDLRTAAKTAGGDLDAKKPTPPPSPSLASVKPDFVFTAEEWREQYKDSQPPFDKYDGKVIELKGIVEYGAQGALLLKAGRPLFDSVVCLMSESEPWRKAFPDQTVILRMQVGKTLWEILNVSGPLPDKFTAEELARAVTKDAKEMEKKYGGKYIIVSGLIEKSDTDKFDFTQVNLQSAQGLPTIKFGFAGTSDEVRKRNKTFRPGMKMTVLGRYDGASLGGRCEVMDLTP